MELAGRETVFFTHTLEEAGLDTFSDNGVPMGNFIQELFSEFLTSKEAARSPTDHAWEKCLPGLFFQSPKKRNSFVTVQFYIEVVYKFGGQAVAVSRLNAVEAGRIFLLPSILSLTPEQVAAQPFQHVTNAVMRIIFNRKKFKKL